MITAAMVRIAVTDRPDDRELVRGLGELRDGLAELNSRDFGWNRLELTADLGRSLGFRIESFKMRRTAVQPHEDAIDVFGLCLEGRCNTTCRARGAGRLQAKQICQSKAQNPSDAKFDEVAPGQAGAVMSEARYHSALA